MAKDITIKAAGLVPDPDDPTKMALAVGGSGADDVIILRPNGVPGYIDVYVNGTYEGGFKPTGKILINADAGNDRVEIDRAITRSARIDGGEGNDTIIGGGGDDTIDGGLGDDAIMPSDGQDLIRGGDGFDSLLVIGTNAADTFSLIQAGNVLKYTLTQTTSSGPATLLSGIGNLAAADVERIDVRMLGGDDSVTMSLALVGVEVMVDAGDGGDVVDLSGVAVDATILGGAGDDRLIGGQTADFIDGGAGDDTVLGLGGDDTILGGDGHDSVTGGPGADRIFGGGDSDTIVWNDGDGSDLIEGGTGTNTLIVNGSASGDTFDLTANGARLVFARSNLTPFVLDVAGVQQLMVTDLSVARETFRRFQS